MIGIRKPKKIIKLANRSRKNRIFFDNLIRELAICLNTGDTSLNRELLSPTYVNHSHANAVDNKETYFRITRDSGMLMKPLGDILPCKLLDQLDAMLASAPACLKRSNSRSLIGDYLIQSTDLNDCHLSALNEMQSINRTIHVTRQPNNP